ncbi:MAG: hypothetical protein IJ225_07620 [Solobacterium sp.]|nr:hypothetical protein [Solobacterium sp.]
MYKKPVILLNEELSEGVYAGSGASPCYRIGGTRMQSWDPSEAGYYKFIIEGVHNETSTGEYAHRSNAQTVTVSFTAPVTLNDSAAGGTVISGNGTQTLVLTYTQSVGEYGQYFRDTLSVSCDNTGVQITGVTITCDYYN